MARRKQRENYGNGSVFAVQHKKLDAKGNVVLDDEGKPVMLQDRDGRGRPIWRICITLGTEEYVDNKGRIRKRQLKAPQKRFHGTLEEARQIAKQLSEEYSSIDPDAAGMPFSSACSSWASSMRNANSCSAVKLKDYETMLDHVSNKFGSKPITDIKKNDVEGALAAVKAERNLSQRRHREMFQTVKRVFEYCIDNNWLIRNPCRSLKTPRVTEEVERRSLEPEECARLRACLDRDELSAYDDFNAKEQRQAEWGNTFTRSKLLGLSHISGLIAVRLMLATGMRRGETLGLTWESVDFKHNQITVRKSLNAQMILKSPKTKKGIRTLAVDADTMAHLRMWHDFQAKALHLIMIEDKNGNRHPVGQTLKTPVCCNCVGGMYDPTKCAEWWRAYRETIGFNSLKMHELRHTQATMLLGHGVGVKDVQARLGHASSALTLDIYGHAIPANDHKAADLMGEIISMPAEPTARVLKVDRKSA